MLVFNRLAQVLSVLVLSLLLPVAVGTIDVADAATAVPVENPYGWRGDLYAGCGDVLSFPVEMITGSSSTAEVAFVGAGASAVPVASSSAMSAGTVSAGSAAAGVAVGLYGFCAGYNAMSWLTGNVPRDVPAYSGPSFQISSGKCGLYIWGDDYAPGRGLPDGEFSQCIKFANSVPSAQYVGYMRRTEAGTAGGALSGFFFAPGAYMAGTPGGSWGLTRAATWGSTMYSSGGWGINVMLELDCRSDDICAIPPNDDQMISVVVLGPGASPHAVIPVDHPSVTKGKYTRFWTQTDCYFTGGSMSQITWAGDWDYAADARTREIPPVDCAGGVPGKVKTYEQELGMDYRGSASRATMPDLDDVPLSGTLYSELDVPAYWRNDPTLRECWLDGLANCTAEVENDGTTTVTNTVNNNTTNVSTTNASVTLKDAVDEIAEAAPDPRPEPPVNGTGTGFPDVDISDPEAPPPPMVGVPPVGSGRFTGCIGDLTDGATDGVTFNPVTWVRALLQYVWAPIFCALWWLIVPEDGWGSIWDRVREVWDENETMVQLRGVFEGSEFVTSCLPVDLRNPWSNSNKLQFDAGMCGNIWLAGVWTLLLGAAAFGMIDDVIETASAFSKRRRYVNYINSLKSS